MRYKLLGPSGLRASEICLGTMSFGDAWGFGAGDQFKIEFFSFLIGAILSVHPEFKGPPMDPPPLPFQLQNPERLRKELAAAGLKDIKVETVTEPLKDLWDWLVSSNSIVETLLSSLNLTDDERVIIRQTLDRMVRERSGGNSLAILTVPINIGVGMK